MRHHLVFHPKAAVAIYSYHKTTSLIALPALLSFFELPKESKSYVLLNTLLKVQATASTALLKNRQVWSVLGFCIKADLSGAQKFEAPLK